MGMTTVPDEKKKRGSEGQRENEDYPCQEEGEERREKEAREARRSRFFPSQTKRRGEGGGKNAWPSAGREAAELSTLLRREKRPAMATVGFSAPLLTIEKGKEREKGGKGEVAKNRPQNARIEGAVFDGVRACGGRGGRGRGGCHICIQSTNSLMSRPLAGGGGEREKKREGSSPSALSARTRTPIERQKGGGGEEKGEEGRRKARAALAS